MSNRSAGPGRARRRRSLSAFVGLLLAIALTAIGLAPAASAAGETLGVNLTSTDGTATFDADDNPGDDSSATNGIVRVNDTVTYNVEVSANGGDSTNATFVIALPAGAELAAVPAYCSGPGSNVTPLTTSAPVVPLTATSFQSLATQTLTCNLGTRASGTTFTYPVTVRIRSEIPNGSTLTVDASVTSDQVTAPVVSANDTTTVSSALRWDLSKNGTAVQPDSGPIAQPGIVACHFDPTQACAVFQYPITLAAPTNGKGAEPATSPITFTDDVTPASLYQLTGTQLATANGDLATYGARLVNCSPDAPYETPGSKIGANAGGAPYTAANAVRDSGAFTCTQPGGPGTPIQISIANTDTSLYTYPTNNKSDAGGSGTAIPANAAYVISSGIYIEFPEAAVTAFGTLSNGVTTFNTKNTLSNLSITGLDGSVETTADQPTDNDFRSTSTIIKPPGTFDKYFVGVPGAAGNTSIHDFSPGYPVLEGPPGNSLKESGHINAAPTQTVISDLFFRGSDRGNSQVVTAIGCDSWDPTKLQIAAGNYPGSTAGALMQLVGSGPNTAVWMSGYNNGPLSGGAATYANSAAEEPAYTVQYSTAPGGAGAASTCNTGTWYNSPAAVPGSNPTLAAQGIYSAVARVRVWVTLPELQPGTSAGADGGGVAASFSVALRVVANATVGEILPNWGAVAFKLGGGESQTAMLADPAVTWNESTYDPSGPSGGAGDRLIAAPAFARITKLVKGPADAGFSSTSPSVTGGQTVQYQLSPSLTTSATATPLAQDVWIEDCLPNSQQFTSATVTPGVVSVGSVPADAKITCPNATDTYIRWDLGQLRPGTAITPIVVSVRVSTLAPDGSYVNTATVWAQNELSTLALRTSTAGIQLVNPAGIKLEKVALTPITEVNRTGQGTNQLSRWSVNLANVNGPTALTNPDVIDVLPQLGDTAGTSFHGSFAFSAASVIAGSGTLEYTSATTVIQDPSDPTNAASGSTTWCTAPTGGIVISGAGSCPSAAAAVTGVRIVSTAAFNPGDVISAEIDLLGIGNAAGDTYVNTTFARVGGLTLPVGPVTAPEDVVSASVGHLVWWDYDHSGGQDSTSAEPGIANVTVNLTGTDDLGNTVSQSAVTDASGNYTIPGLRAGNYDVAVSAGLPAGALPQYDLDDGTVNANSDSGTFALAQAQVRTDVNFGYGIVPQLSTVTSATTEFTGAPLSDTVTVTDSGGQPGSLAWQLLGPVDPISGSCTGASWTAAPVIGTGTAAVTGDGPVTVGPVAAGHAGCYTWTETLTGPNYAGPASSAAGLVAETTLISIHTPTVTTSVSGTSAHVGDGVTDAVTISGSSGAASTITWSLLGPVAATSAGTCPGQADAAWASAATVATGTVATTGDGTFGAPGTAVTLDAVGCYTFVDTLAATPDDTDVVTPVGVVSETVNTTIAPPPVDLSDHVLGLTGGDVLSLLGAAVVLLVVGGIVLLLIRNRRRSA